MARKGGSRRKRVGILTKSTRAKGKVSIRSFLQELSEGDRVTLKMEPAIQNGMYLPRYHGKAGTIGNKQGDCYEVTIKDGNASKLLIVHPIHLRKN